jgi:hypothetical protein
MRTLREIAKKLLQNGHDFGVPVAYNLSKIAESMPDPKVTRN